MIQTIFQYTGDGVTTNFTGPFCDFDVSDLLVTVDNLEVEFTYNSQTQQVTITPAPGGGKAVEIARVTQLDERLVVFTNATLLDAPTQNLDSTQLFYALQERLFISDESMKYGGATGVNWNARNKLIKLVSDPVDNLDAVNKQFLVEYATAFFASALSTAEGYKDAAALSASAALTSENNAQASADDAAVSEANAEQSAIDAAASAAAAATFEPSDYAIAAKGVTNGDSHDHNGGDGAAITEAAITLADNTTNNVSITKHGLVPKAPNDTLQFFRGDGTWAIPEGFNPIINGNFDVWERVGNLSSGTGARFCSDRWKVGSVGTTYSTSYQFFTVGQTDVPNNPRTFLRVIPSSVAGAANYCHVMQKIEYVRTFSGRTATLSFWAKADANKSISVEFAQCFGTGGSPSASVTGIGVTKVNLTTAWQRFDVTVALPSISGKTLGTGNDDWLGVYFWLDAGSNFNSQTNSLGQQSGTFDFSQIHMTQGSKPSPFPLRTIAEELALCQRYFWKMNTTCRLDAYLLGGGWHVSSLHYPVSMRKAPTRSDNWADGVNNAQQVVSQACESFCQPQVQAIGSGTCAVSYSSGNTFDAEL